MTSVDESGKTQVEFRRQVLAFTLWLAGAAAIGGTTGLLHSVIGEPLMLRFTSALDTPLKIVAGAGCVAATLLGGIGLYALTRRLLRWAQCSDLAVGVTMAFAVSALAGYTFWGGTWVVQAGPWFTDSEGIPLAVALLVALAWLVNAGVVLIVMIASMGISEPRVLAVIVYFTATSAYLAAMVLWSAVRTIRGQKRLANCREGTGKGT